MTDLLLRTPFADWTARRWVVAVLLVPVLLAWFARAGGSTDLVTVGGVPVWWGTLVIITAVTGSLVVAGYVPATGWRPDLGCTTCASVSALTLLGATVALRSGAPGDPGSAALAFAVVAFGLLQRVTAPATCEVPAPDRG